MWVTFLRVAKGEPGFDQTYPHGVEKVFDRVWIVDNPAKKPVDCREKFFPRSTFCPQAGDHAQAV